MSVSEERIYELINAAECGAIASSIRAAIREAVEAERERCARIVEKGLGRTNTYIARSIRNGDAP